SAGALLGNGTNTWSGTVTFATDSTISTPLTTDNLSLGGLLTGSGGFNKIGMGTLQLTGTTANNYSGQTFVSNGTLLLDCGFFTGVFPNLTFNPVPAVPG